MDLKDKILKAEDIEFMVLEVKEWGVNIMVQGLDGAGRARVMSRAFDDDGNPDLESVYPDLLLASLRDPETRELIFAEEDREKLLSKSGKVIERLSQVAAKMSGLNQTALEDAEKN